MHPPIKQYIMRRFFLLIISLAALVPAVAQLAVGSWKQYPVFGDFSDLIDTGDKVWYVTGGCLYCYDTEADETRFYENGKDLSDFNVKFIRYNKERDMLAVAFDNANMDLILSDGQRVNLPDIKDAIVNVEKEVNDIVFDGDDIYVATGFGLVIYDADRMEVRESGIYGFSVATVMPVPGYIVISSAEHDNWRYPLYRIERGTRINNFDKFTLMGSYYDVITEAVPLNDECTQYAQVRSSRMGAMEFYDDGSYRDYHDLKLNGSSCNATSLTRFSDGKVYFISDKGVIAHYDGISALAADAALPESFAGNRMSASQGLSSVWLAASDGLGRYRIADDGGMTVLRDKSVPSDAISFSDVCNIFPTSDNRGLYICNLGSTQTHPIGKGSNYELKLGANLLENGVVQVINPVGVSAKIGVTQNSQSKYGKYIFAPICIAEDPDDTAKIYIGTAAEGIYIVKDNQEIGRIDGDNSYMEKLIDIYWTVCDIKIDREGNMWVANATYDLDKHPIQMLPAQKRRQDPSTITKDDWLIPDFGRLIYHKDVQLLISSKSNMIFVKDGEAENGIVVLDHNGTLADLSDDKYEIWTSFTDQDGKTFSPVLWTCMAEDKRGQVWLGSSSGVVSVTDPSKACDGDFRINRIKVPRNDGSGLADYLLETDQIVAIAVDNSDRKWIGTKNSGLYLVSEDGDEIIASYTMSNSPLPTNTITALYADPNSNSIFVGTLSGLYEYSSTSSPSKPDYSDVYAYPNPVTPDYTGWITIAGLMDSSLVKIVDSAMNLVYQTISEGGMAVWDGCNMGGSRVRSGVYYVLASTSDASSSSAVSTSSGDVVAKILVVN